MNTVLEKTFAIPAGEPRSRKSRRYRLDGHAFFLWEGPDGLLRGGSGTIRDISSRGIFVVADVAPPLGACLDVEVYFASLKVSGGILYLHGEGTAVRIDSGDDGCRGFGADVAFQTEVSSSAHITGTEKPQ